MDEASLKVILDITSVIMNTVQVIGLAYIAAVVGADSRIAARDRERNST